MNHDRKTLVIFLRSLADIPDQELQRVLPLFQPRRLTKGELFLRADDVPEQIGFLVSGLMRLYYMSENGEEVTKSFILESDFVAAYNALLLREPSRLWIDALENSYLFTASFEEYRVLADQHICWQIVNRKLAESLFIKKERREAALLLDDAKTRYQAFLAEYPNLEDRVRQHHIASYLGISPVSLSRIRARMGLT